MTIIQYIRRLHGSEKRGIADADLSARRCPVCVVGSLPRRDSRQHDGDAASRCCVDFSSGRRSTWFVVGHFYALCGELYCSVLHKMENY